MSSGGTGTRSAELKAMTSSGEEFPLQGGMCNDGQLYSSRIGFRGCNRNFRNFRFEELSFRVFSQEYVMMTPSVRSIFE